jgi:hypothetical protein
MIRATALLATPSTVSWPTESELMTVLVVELGLCQPGETTYQSGSAWASVSLSRPSVRQGRRPTAGTLQLPAATPSSAGLPELPAASGQGSLPGSFSSVWAARMAM